MRKKLILPAILYFLINGTFMLKYAVRLTELAWILVFIYFAIVVLIVFKHEYWDTKISFHKSQFILIFITVIAGVIIWQNLPVDQLRVDRWSVISSFLDNLLAGEFPYEATSHLNNPPGPFPFHYVLAFPFYLIGEIGYFTVMGFIGFYLIVRYYSQEIAGSSLPLLLLFLSPAWWWELAVRSTILINMVMVIAWLLWLKGNFNRKSESILHIAFIGGLLVSTRGIVGVIMISVLSYMFYNRDKFTHWLAFTLIMGMGFVSTLIPFMIWDAGLFFKYNPVTLQAGFLPLWILVLIFFITALSGKWISSITHLIKLSGPALFVIVFLSITKTIFQVGLTQAIRDSVFDISYFLFALPFLLLMMVPSK